MKTYALYKGEGLLASGTINEIANELNIKPATIKFYGCSAYRERTSETSVKGTRRLVCLDEMGSKERKSLKSQKVRERNKCSTCERKSDWYQTGCQVFTEEPENCWAHTTDKDWLRKVEKVCKEYREGKPKASADCDEYAK